MEKKEGEKLDPENELEEVKVISGDEEAAATDEKKDSEKPEKPYNKYLNHAKDAKNQILTSYNALDRQKQLGMFTNTLCYRIIVMSRLFFCQKIPSNTPLFDPSRLLILAIHLSICQIIFDYVN